MNLKSAQLEAEDLLRKIIENQPNLIINNHGHTRISGKSVAEFCGEFINCYAEYLVKRPTSEN